MSSSLEQPLDGSASQGGVSSADLRFAQVNGNQDTDAATSLTGMDHSNFMCSRAHDGDSSLRVLLVDDHEDMLGLMRMMMERRSYRVEIAICGADALSLAPEFQPQVVVSDIGMPGMDGYEMMAALRSMPTLPPFKSIALSGYDANEEEPRARAAGYDAQLTKPVDFAALFQAIDSLALAA